MSDETWTHTIEVGVSGTIIGGTTQRLFYRGRAEAQATYDTLKELIVRRADKANNVDATVSVSDVLGDITLRSGDIVTVRILDMNEHRLMSLASARHEKALQKELASESATETAS